MFKGRVIVIACMFGTLGILGCSHASEPGRVVVPGSAQCMSESQPNRKGPTSWNDVKRLFPGKRESVAFKVDEQVVTVTGITRQGVDAQSCPTDVLRSLEFEVPASTDPVQSMKSVLRYLHGRGSGLVPTMDDAKITMVENDFTDMLMGTGVFTDLDTIGVPNQHDFEGEGHLALKRSADGSFKLIVTLDYFIN